MTRLIGTLTVLVFALYPLLVYFGLGLFEPRWLVVLLVLVPALARLMGGPAGPTPLRMAGLWLLVPVAALLAATIATNDERVLRLYPFVMNAALATAFVVSLGQSQTLIERIARLQEPALPPEGVAYCRQVTRVWAAFMTANALVALWTALIGSREVWVLYNGLISYLCIGLLFTVEYLVRRHVRQRGNPPAGA